MPILHDYAHFTGRHYETGSLHNALAYAGYDLSEALLLGISGGITVGYFSFAYEGYDPHIALLTRNTFDPFSRLTERLGIAQDVQQTTSADKAQRNLAAALERGSPALVWVDMFSLPYHLSDRDDDMQMMIPVVVYGTDDNTVYVADRANVPFEIAADDFLAARGIVKKTRYKLLTIEDVNLSRVPSAIEQGLHDTVRLFNGDVPVKPAAKSIGYNGMTRWAHCLTQRSDRQSWQKIFPPGRTMYAGLATTFTSIEIANGAGAERERFAACLDEAADILARPALREVADGYRELAPLWTNLADAHLPDSIPRFAEARELFRREAALFITQGYTAHAERQRIHEQLQAIRQSMEDDFPLSDDASADLREALATQVLALCDREQAQIDALQTALA